MHTKSFNINISLESNYEAKSIKNKYILQVYKYYIHVSAIKQQNYVTKANEKNIKKWYENKEYNIT